MKTIASCGFALALLGTLALDAAAQTSCGGWCPICRQRCTGMKTGCSHCDELMERCRKTGCWTEGIKYGRQRHCNLKKA
jgi:hypothetical protein